MICKNCGKEMPDDARFCPGCGAVGGTVQNSPGYPALEKDGPESPLGGKKKTGLLIGGVLAIAAVAVAAVVAVSGLLASSKGLVERSAAKSAAAYAQASESMGLPDLSGLSWEQNISQSFALELNRINSELAGMDMSALSGLGLRMTAGLSGRERCMDFEMAGFWEDRDLISLRVAARDDEMYFGSPELTGGKFYGVNTETLGADLAAQSDDGDENIKNISFNFFELMDMVLDMLESQREEQLLERANKALWEAAKVKKEGAKTLSINGNSTKTTIYRLTFPQDALADYADAVAEAMSAINYRQMYEEIFQAVGIPEEEAEDFLSELENRDVYEHLAGWFKDMLEETGDLELRLCLSGGYVSAVLYEGELGGTDIELALYLGGGENYVDNLSLEMEVDGEKLTVKSSGDHGGKSGVFTDKTTIRAAMASVTSEFRYEPKGEGDNLSWDIVIPGGGSLNMAGSLTAPNGNSICLNLKEISLKVIGLEVCSLNLEYNAGPFQGAAAMESGAEIITRMSEEQLRQMVLDTQECTLAWAQDMEALFISRLPADLLYGMMYG